VKQQPARKLQIMGVILIKTKARNTVSPLGQNFLEKSCGVPRYNFSQTTLKPHTNTPAA
jgi:hypothetical protein